MVSGAELSLPETALEVEGRAGNKTQSVNRED